MTDTFTWLHFSDLHCGSKYAQDYWINIEENLIKDIKSLRQKNNLSIDAILFTGDLVNRGVEYSEFNDWLGRLKELFPMEDIPILLPVPGNHDLVRPCKSGEDEDSLRIIKERWDDDEKVRNRIWGKNENSKTWKIIQKSFENYNSWLMNPDRPFPFPKNIKLGLLPGEFAYTFFLDNGSKIGVIGLNSAFLQLDDDGLNEKGYKGHLDLHISQLSHLFDDKNHVDWFRELSLCLVMTHHPVDWLSARGKREFLEEINKDGRCHLHLCGHMHENTYRQWSNSISNQSWKMWMGHSLFGMEQYIIQKGSDQEKYTDRRHGYSLGSMTIDKQKGNIRIWPRKTNIHKRFATNIDIAEKKEYCDINIEINTSLHSDEQKPTDNKERSDLNPKSPPSKKTTKIKQPNQEINQEINQEMMQLIKDHCSSEEIFNDLCLNLNITNDFQWNDNPNDSVTALCKRLEGYFSDSVDRLHEVLLLRNKILTDECNAILIGDEQVEKPPWASNFGNDDDDDGYGYWADIDIEGITQRFRFIKSGVFRMGSPEKDEDERFSSEIQHKVILTDPFWMAEHVCTQELWEKIMDDNPSKFKGLQLPAENLNWNKCKEFIGKINQKEPAYQFDLPTEAQWEYCCRAGTEKPFSYGVINDNYFFPVTTIKIPVFHSI